MPAVTRFVRLVGLPRDGRVPGGVTATPAHRGLTSRVGAVHGCARGESEAARARARVSMTFDARDLRYLCGLLAIAATACDASPGPPDGAAAPVWSPCPAPDWVP